MKIKFDNYTNCYEKCKYNYYFDKDNNYHCTVNSSCPKDYPKLMEDKLECIANDINNVIQDLAKFEKNATKEISKEEEIEYYDNIMETIENIFTDNYDTSKLDEGKDEVIETEKMTITFTTTKNQNNNINNNMTSIDL